MKNEGSKKRKWQQFPGNNRFFCNGRCMMSKRCGTFCFTFLTLVIVSLLFFIFVCPFMAEEVSIAIPIIGTLLVALVLLTMLRTSCTDPGIIPRASPEEGADTERKYSIHPNSKPNAKDLPIIDLKIKNTPIKLKYCTTCKIFRPPRASHCSVCDNCVERFDHHCPWVGNCIGRRNYRVFYMFVVLLAVVNVFILSCSITQLVLKLYHHNVIEVFKESPSLFVTIFIILACFCSVWSILGLVGYHTYLVTVNQTTNEDIKGTYSYYRFKVTNPFTTQNACTNYCLINCYSLPPSYIDARGFVEEAGEPKSLPSTKTTSSSGSSKTEAK